MIQNGKANDHDSHTEDFNCSLAPISDDPMQKRIQFQIETRPQGIAATKQTWTKGCPIASRAATTL